jgi:hypothetical protein
MTPSTSLTRMLLTGRLCRLGAWIIAVAGFIVIVLYFVLTY